MLGARLAWVFAGIVLVLPLLFGAAFAGAVVYGVTGYHTWGEGPLEAPLHALVVLMWLAVGAAVYRRRAGLE
jgi:hypothetical protein